MEEPGRARSPAESCERGEGEEGEQSWEWDGEPGRGGAGREERVRRGRGQGEEGHRLLTSGSCQPPADTHGGGSQGSGRGHVPAWLVFAL